MSLRCFLFLLSSSPLIAASVAGRQHLFVIYTINCIFRRTAYCVLSSLTAIHSNIMLHHPHQISRDVRCAGCMMSQDRAPPMPRFGRDDYCAKGDLDASRSIAKNAGTKNAQAIIAANDSTDDCARVLGRAHAHAQRTAAGACSHERALGASHARRPLRAVFSRSRGSGNTGAQHRAIVEDRPCMGLARPRVVRGTALAPSLAAMLVLRVLAVGGPL